MSKFIKKPFKAEKGSHLVKMTFFGSSFDENKKWIPVMRKEECFLVLQKKLDSSFFKIEGTIEGKDITIVINPCKIND